MRPTHLILLHASTRVAAGDGAECVQVRVSLYYTRNVISFDFSDDVDLKHFTARAKLYVH